MKQKSIRVFPRRTSYTPTDEFAFIGDPPMSEFRPKADEVHISCTFTWDREQAQHLVAAWGQYYPYVKLGGAAVGKNTMNSTLAQVIARWR